MLHDWHWIDQEERHLGSNPNRPYAVDIWRCSGCGQTRTVRGARDPKSEGCTGSSARGSATGEAA